ncbi:hypothetical protein BP6252_01219 [Coleophoma cylindrospora]|uniref:Heme haloperoxidase family profile domain-containing protein n=1 Tax=Coleophoma cylindrospora TaxID=1849047 RepID=A0A3D8SSB1_9HELO|nr:hypothetical protein BP6252_01219 [Coleophoma cylindrospora]
MLFKSLALTAAVVGSAVAQRPSNESICDYYTTALLKNNTAANQLTLLTLVVNTAVIGNYTTPNVGIMVPGILAPGTFNGTDVNLAPYFSGALASTNTGGSSGMSVNFLDGGGADPLKMNKPANDTTSNQYILLTHLYEYFGTLLGCSMQGTSSDYVAYSGDESMYEVHKFMDLSAAEVGYFITQVALSGASFGVTAEDLQPVGTALSTLFGHRCSAATVVIPTQQSALQAICIDDTCPVAVTDANCTAYTMAAVEPVSANSSNIASSTAHGTATSTGSSSATATSSGAAATATKNAAAQLGVGMAAVAGGFAALLL